MVKVDYLKEYRERYLGSFYEEPAWKKRMKELTLSEPDNKESELPKTTCSGTYSS
jgi:hypothetical protein